MWVRAIQGLKLWVISQQKYKMQPIVAEILTRVGGATSIIIVRVSMSNRSHSYEY